MPNPRPNESPASNCNTLKDQKIEERMNKTNTITTIIIITILVFSIACPVSVASDFSLDSGNTSAAEILKGARDRDRKEQLANAEKRSVVMYGTSWYGYCKKARRYFRRKGIEFIEFNKLGGKGILPTF